MRCAGLFSAGMCTIGSRPGCQGADGLRLPYPVERSYTCELDSERPFTATHLHVSLTNTKSDI